MAATLKQIAQKTGFSLPTVHQILNGYNVPFAEATRQKVLAAAKELNYKPNITARSLVKGRSMLLGVLYNGVNHDIVTDFMRGVQSMITPRQYVPVLLTHTNAIEESANLNTVRDRGVDGLIVNLSVEPESASNAEVMSEIHRSGTPMVEVFGRFMRDVPNVTLDFQAAAAVATQKLIEQGHTRIAMVVREYPSHSQALYWAPRDFAKGYDKTIADAGLEPIVLPYKVTTDLTRPYASFRGAYDVAETLLLHPLKPTAVVCYRSEAAEAIMTWCDRHENQVRDGFTIVTFGSARPMVPSKYTMQYWSIGAEDAGRSAAAMVFDQIDGKPTSNVQLTPTAAV